MDLTIEHAPAGDLLPNDWNPNVMSERVMQAERESIERYGFIDPITTRQHPTKKGKLQIVDGEHRWRVAVEMGMEEVPVIKLDITDDEARKLTIILNETRGRADVIELADLLADLDSRMETDELLRGLPYSNGELEEMLEMSGLDLPDYSDGRLDVSAEQESGTRTIQFAVDEKTGKLWDRVQRESAKRHGKPKSEGESAAGVIFARVLTDWLKG